MAWKMIVLIIWIQVLFNVNGLKLEINIKPIDGTVENSGLSDNSPTEPDRKSNASKAYRQGDYLQYTDRIVGGVVPHPHSLPWQVVLEINRQQCGGAILCPKFVMTAGHCVVKPSGGLSDPKTGVIHAGRHDLNKKEASASKHSVKAFHLHPAFKPFIQGIQDNDINDFAIVELMNPIVLRKEAKALFLPKPSDTEFGADTKFIVSGWGKESWNGQVSNVLKMITVPWISDADCKQAYKDAKANSGRYAGTTSKFFVSNSNICAGVLGVGKIDACAGDSGGPMAWIDPKTTEVKLIGATSFGHECAKADSPGVYAEITFALGWIKKIIGRCNEETCSQGMCMTQDSLHRSILKAFNRITPH